MKLHSHHLALGIQYRFPDGQVHWTIPTLDRENIVNFKLPEMLCHGVGHKVYKTQGR